MLKKQLLTSLVLSVFGILIGILFFFINSDILLRVLFVFIGAYIILLSIPGFITFSSIQDKSERTFTLVSSIVIAAIGLSLISYPHVVVNIIAGLLFIALPIYRIVMSENKQETLKKEIIKMCLGVVLILCGFGSVFQILLYVIGALIILLSIIYIIYNIILYIKINKAHKQYKEESDVIDV